MTASEMTCGQNLICIRLFQSTNVQKIQDFEHDLVPVGWSRETVDLDCTDVVQKTNKELIQDVIDHIIEEEATARNEGIEYDLDANTERAKLESVPDPKPCKLRSYDLFKNRTERDVKLTRSHKQINYIASMMKEQPHGADERQIGQFEVMLTVALYHPTKMLKQQEFQVLGSQPLTALRDRLYCLADYLLDGQQSRSGFFLIENTFYNDLRNANNIDYSKNIRDWTDEKKRYTTPGIGILNSRKMEETTFIDLNIRIGQPYLYVHQGNCEHNIVFTEVRMVTESDVQAYSAYPRHIFQAKIRRRKCKICDIFPARYVTYNDRMATEDPFFFCEHCYRPLHYDFEGRIL
ncbi:MAG: putative snRNA transcription factor, partial [Streblomastix strix]